MCALFIHYENGLLYWPTQRREDPGGRKYQQVLSSSDDGPNGLSKTEEEREHEQEKKKKKKKEKKKTSCWPGVYNSSPCALEDRPDLRHSGSTSTASLESLDAIGCRPRRQCNVHRCSPFEKDRRPCRLVALLYHWPNNLPILLLSIPPIDSDCSFGFIFVYR